MKWYFVILLIGIATVAGVLVYTEASASVGSSNTASTVISSMKQTNNPGSIIYDPKDFSGIVNQYNGFSVFDTLTSGVKALQQNLQAYFQEGYRTLTDISNRWTTTNPTGWANIVLQSANQAPIFSGANISLNTDISAVNGDLQSMAYVLAGICKAEGNYVLSPTDIVNYLSGTGND